MNPAQAGPITLETPLGDGVVFRSMEGREALSEPFQYRLDVASPRSDLKPTDWLDHSVTVRIERTDSGGATPPRCWNGRVTEFEPWNGR